MTLGVLRKTIITAFFRSGTCVSTHALTAQSHPHQGFATSKACRASTRMSVERRSHRRAARSRFRQQTPVSAPQRCARGGAHCACSVAQPVSALEAISFSGGCIIFVGVCEMASSLCTSTCAPLRHPWAKQSKRVEESREAVAHRFVHLRCI